jgi:hypothetical protein
MTTRCRKDDCHRSRMTEADAIRERALTHVRSWRMTCPLCGRRKGRRSCPALSQTICAVCCATKRLVEIDCPDNCPHLTAAREHPAAQVKRQQERDVAVLFPSIQHLTERQHQLFFLFHTAIARHTPEGFSRIVDDDVAQAAGAVASTLETAARGVIYEHSPSSMPAARLATELTRLLGQIRAQGGTVSDAEAAIALRAIEQGARDARKAQDGTETAYVALIARLLQVRRAQGANPQEPARNPSPLILP